MMEPHPERGRWTQRPAARLGTISMMCPSCRVKNRESAKFCTKCGTNLIKEPGDPSIDTGPYPSVFQQYHHLMYREPSRYSPPAVQPGGYPLTHGPRDQAVGFVGDERSIAWSLILSLMTCGIYGFVWLYKIGNDLRRRLGRDEPHAGMDVFLTILTCGLWGVYVAYKYPKLIDDIERKVGLPESNLSLVCLLLSVFGLWKVYGLGLISLALMQNQLNRIWQTLRGLRSRNPDWKTPPSSRENPWNNHRHPGHEISLTRLTWLSSSACRVFCSDWRW